MKILYNIIYINLCKKDIKQVILVRTDLKMPKGKLAVQVAHVTSMFIKDAIYQESIPMPNSKDKSKNLLHIFIILKQIG